MSQTVEQRTACFLCGGTRLKPRFRWNAQTLVRCRDCHLLFRLEPASLATQQTYYVAPYYARKPAYFSTAIEDDDESSRVRMYRRILEQLAQRTTPGVLVDGGCGLGTFVRLAQQHGWRAIGVELSRYATHYAREHFGIVVEQADLQHLGLRSSSVDVVTLLDILGECADPVAVLQEAHRILRPGGRLVVAVVDLDSVLYRSAEWIYRISGGLYAEPIRRGLPADHTAFFSMRTLQALLTRHGFRVQAANRLQAATEHVMSFTSPRLRLPLALLTWLGEVVGRPLECCVYAVKT